MAKEIERKFLVLGDAWRGSVSSVSSIQQAYIVCLGNRSVRVRILDAETAKLTIKIGRNATTRDEYEYDVPLADAQEMMADALGQVIQKTRYRVEHGAFLWEIDVFHGCHSGLVTAEVEMRSENDDPALPDWLGPEITGDRRYSNQSLATATLSGEYADGLSHPAR